MVDRKRGAPTLQNFAHRAKLFLFTDMTLFISHFKKKQKNVYIKIVDTSRQRQHRAPSYLCLEGEILSQSLRKSAQNSKPFDLRYRVSLLLTSLFCTSFIFIFHFNDTII